jgi:hypothetical protein
MAVVKKKTVVELSFDDGELEQLRSALKKLTSKEVGYNARTTLTDDEIKVLNDIKTRI